jgi:hypothetical protein
MVLFGFCYILNATSCNISSFEKWSFDLAIEEARHLFI